MSVQLHTNQTMLFCFVFEVMKKKLKIVWGCLGVPLFHGGAPRRPQPPWDVLCEFPRVFGKVLEEGWKKQLDFIQVNNSSKVSMNQISTFTLYPCKREAHMVIWSVLFFPTAGLPLFNRSQNCSLHNADTHVLVGFVEHSYSNLKLSYFKVQIRPMSKCW